MSRVPLTRLFSWYRMSKKWRKPKPTIRASKADKPRHFFCAAQSPCVLAAPEQEGALPSFDGIAYTGAPMTPMGWYGQIILDLAGVKVPQQHRPALHVHNHESIVGHTTEVSVGKEGIRVKGVFSGQSEFVDKVTVPAKNGFKWQMSVGANPLRTEYLEDGAEAEVNGITVKGPITISRETELGEVSFVPLGADGATSVKVAATIGENMNHFAASLKALMNELRADGKQCKYSDEEIDKMDASTAKAALKEAMKGGDEPDDYDDAEAGKFPGSSSAVAIKAKNRLVDLAEQSANEIERQDAIKCLAEKYGVTKAEVDGKEVSIVPFAIRANWDATKMELACLRAERPSKGVGVPGGLGYSVNTPQLTEQVFEAALLQAARHQMRLEDDDFYSDSSPDGSLKLRRIPESLQRQTQAEFKSRYTDQVQQTAHTAFKGRITPQQFLKAAFRANGHHSELDFSGEHSVRSALAAWDMMDKQAIRAEGSSNMSISNILANVLNKFALQGYLFVEQSWREISGIRPVNDFKPVKSINLLGDVMYRPLGPSGELANASFQDQAFANLAAPFGIIATIPWTHLVNDDLGMLTQVPLKIGQGAGLKLNDVFWSLWASLASGSAVGSQKSNPVFSANGDDGNAFWRTSTSSSFPQYAANKLSGATTNLSATSLNSAKKLFDNQIDPNGNPLGFAGMQPVLLFGPSNWKTATELLTAEYIITAGLASNTAFSSFPNKNVWQGALKPVMSRYIDNASYVNSTTAWWILFNPAALPVIEACFLNGVDTPAVLQAGPDYQFDRLGISIRGTMPFGVTQQNFRAGVYSVGA